MINLRLAPAVLLFLAAGACGTPATSSTPSPTPREVLFAVVEGRSGQSQPGTVAIVGLDGRVRESATFQLRAVGPVMPDAYTPVQKVAQVAGSAVYYIDAGGTVRVLRPGSQPQVVARFPLQPAQEDAWFAVSPDGSRVMTGILTFPALGPVIQGTSWNTLVGPTKFDLQSAPAGGQTTTLVHWETSDQWLQRAGAPMTIWPVGWIQEGPVGMVPKIVTSQNMWPGGHLYLIDDSGKQGRLLGGSDCNSAAITSHGFIACTTDASDLITVRDQAGSVVWSTHLQGFTAWSNLVSSDGQAVLNDSQVETRGGMVQLPDGFRAQGWLDSTTVVGRVEPNNGDPGDLLWINVNQPSVVHDLGVKADFVGPLG
jgi:hypothetical protein